MYPPPSDVAFPPPNIAPYPLPSMEAYPPQDGSAYPPHTDAAHPPPTQELCRSLAEVTHLLHPPVQDVCPPANEGQEPTENRAPNYVGLYPPLNQATNKLAMEEINIETDPACTSQSKAVSVEEINPTSTETIISLEETKLSDVSEKQ